MWQDIPDYGRAVFFREAGSLLQFYLESVRSVTTEQKQVRVLTKTPAWIYPQRTEVLAEVKLHRSNRPVMLDSNHANQLLAVLQLGHFPQIKHDGWFLDHQVDVLVSAINFTVSYHDYIACVASLFPFNFNQLQRSTILFATNEDTIRTSYIDRLQVIADYMKLDEEVKNIYIDGHTDSIGRKGYNWDLSKRRTEKVKDHLIKLGIAAEKIIFRHHGESMPIVRNNTNAHRARNRRVTLRLEK